MTASKPERRCLGCGGPISPRQRSDAVCCSKECRTVVSRVRRLAAGRREVDGYVSVASAASAATPCASAGRQR